MTPTRQAPERETGIPTTVRCRPDEDGVVVWVPVEDVGDIGDVEDVEHDEPEFDDVDRRDRRPDPPQVDEG
jgi:hypothetical protein